MSIPTDALRYAGVWDAIETYKYGMFVVSPIDNKAYVWIGSNPVVGGADPSVPNPDWVNIPPTATGDITGIIAGTGIGGGGSAGVVTIDNTGVLSVDGNTGALTTQTAQYYKSATQTLNTVASPAFTTLTFDTDGYTGTAITRTVGSPTFQWVVNTKGVYSFDLHVQLSGVGAGDFADPTIRLSLNLQRGAQNNSVLTNVSEITNATPTNPAIALSGNFACEVGDLIVIQIVYYLNAGQSIFVNGPSASPNDYDLNTFWSWTLVKPLP